MKVQESPEGFAEFGRWLDERPRAAGRELWAAIEKPEGRIVDFLLDHGVVVYPINPKALDRARDRFRMSGAKSDPFDAYVLARSSQRTDQAHLRVLRPNSEKAQELKMPESGSAPSGAPENAVAQSAHHHAQRVLCSAPGGL